MNKEEIEKQEDKYFISKIHRYIFALVELDGANRAKILGITQELYHDKDKAKIWRDTLAKQIHPDVCCVDGAEAAVAKVNELYSRMVEDE
jgi:hypothetical protein